MPLPNRLRGLLDLTSPAVWILILLATGSGLLVLVRPSSRPEGMLFWLFARNHVEAYQALISTWNERQTDTSTKVTALLLSGNALERRLLSAFMSGTQAADLVEIERNMAGRAFGGPLEDIGFIDLTDRLREEGLLEIINPPSFTPWTSRGRIFGLPHDVHPVLLAYRADIVEAAGIDLESVETWQQFFQVMRPLMTDDDGDGRPDR
jgi:arabinosaccharide transport system substrate-binding protein